MHRKSKKVEDLTKIGCSSSSPDEEGDDGLSADFKYLTVIDLLNKYKVEIAAKEGDYDTVERLLKLGTPLSKCDDLLHKAIKSGNPAVVEILLKYGADANGIILSAETSRMIHFAASFMQPDTVRVLVKYGADVNDTRSRYERTPLFWAFISPDPHAASPWLERCVTENMVLCSIRQRDEFDEPERFEKLYHTINALLECGADVNISDRTGKVPLHFCTTAYYSCKPLLLHKIATLIVKFVALEKIKTGFISEGNADIISQPCNTFLSDVYEAYVLEINAMKSIHICSTISFYDILIGSPNYLAEVVKDSAVTSTFQSVEYIHEFTSFAEYLKKQYEKGCIRRELLDASVKPLGYFVNNKLPANLIVRVLHELNDCDLENVVDAYKDI